MVVHKPHRPETEELVAGDPLHHQLPAQPGPGDQHRNLPDSPPFHQRTAPPPGQRQQQEGQPPARHQRHARIQLHLPRQRQIAEKQEIAQTHRQKHPAQLLHRPQRRAGIERVAVVEPDRRVAEQHHRHQRPQPDALLKRVIGPHQVIDPQTPGQHERGGKEIVQQQQQDPATGFSHKSAPSRPAPGRFFHN